MLVGSVDVFPAAALVAAGLLARAGAGRVSSAVLAVTTASACVISPTTEGWLIVCPEAMGSGMSS